LNFNFRAQASFFICATARLLFSFAPSFLFSAAAPGLFDQELRFLFNPQASLFASRHALDFFFDRAKSRFGTSSQFIFLSAFARFQFQIVTFFFGAPARLFFFSLAQGRELRLVRLLANAEALFGFVTALFFASSQRFQDRLRARNFFISDTPSLVFFSACASFSFNPPAFVLSALPRNFLFLLPPFFLLNAQGVLRRQACSLNFRAAALFVNSEPREFGL